MSFMSLKIKPKQMCMRVSDFVAMIEPHEIVFNLDYYYEIWNLEIEFFYVYVAEILLKIVCFE